MNSNKIDKPTNDFRGFCSTKKYNGEYGFFVDYPDAYELFKDKQITIVSAYYWKDWSQYSDISNVSVKINEYYPNNIFICTSTEDAAGWPYGCKFSVG